MKIDKSYNFIPDLIIPAACCQTPIFFRTNLHLESKIIKNVVLYTSIQIDYSRHASRIRGKVLFLKEKQSTNRYYI